jgi:hypothetical protein
MLFRSAIGSSPRVLTMFMAEKPVDISRIEIGLRVGESRCAPLDIDVNPVGQPIDPGFGNVITWLEPGKARPSAKLN